MKADVDNVTVGGLPGTGTTTLCRLLQPRLGLDYTYAGQIFRDEAARRGLDLAAFGDRQRDLLRHGGVLLEGRLSGWIAHQDGIPALKVWLECEDDERVRRIVDRDGGDATLQRDHIRRREASEAARYRSYYGIDLEDLAPYDLVLDSTRTAPEALAESVESAWQASREAT